jgi:hypothetical protein
MIMKKKTRILFGLAGMMMMLMGGMSALAQQIQYNFNMSSSFYAGNAKMPAGSYKIMQLQDQPDTYILQNKTGTHSVMVETRPSSKTSKGKPEVLFNRYGTTDYLEAVETSDGNSIDIMLGVAEKIAAKKATPQPHTVPTA